MGAPKFYHQNNPPEISLSLIDDSCFTIILYKKVAVDNILWGEMYLVAFSLDGDDYVAIKYIQKANDPQKVTLVSRNSSYAPQDIPWNSIRALALIKASIRFNTMG